MQKYYCNDEKQLHYLKKKALTVFPASLMTPGSPYMKYNCFVGTGVSDLWQNLS